MRILHGVQHQQFVTPCRAVGLWVGACVCVGLLAHQHPDIPFNDGDLQRVFTKSEVQSQSGDDRIYSRGDDWASDPCWNCSSGDCLRLDFPYRRDVIALGGNDDRSFGSLRGEVGLGADLEYFVACSSPVFLWLRPTSQLAYVDGTELVVARDHLHDRIHPHWDSATV